MSQTNLTGLSQRFVVKGLLTEREARRVQTQAQRDKLPLTRFLVEHSILENRQIIQVAAEEFGLPVCDLNALSIPPETIALVQERLILQLDALPICKRGQQLFVAISDPADTHSLDEIQFHTGLKVVPVLAEPTTLQQNIIEALDKQHISMAGLDDASLDELEFSSLDDSEREQNTADADVDDAPLVRLVNKLMLDAINQNASDIHFEPYENSFRIRFRLDGIMQEVTAPPATLANRVVARIKVMARLDTSERRLPQDGRIKLRLSRTRSIDFRVNTCPTLFGEKVVLRILDSGGLKLGIDALGFTATQKQTYLQAIHRPQGMVLVTGPTGSGKTVTLYNAVNILNTSDRNISTVEDPAEIYVPGINQVNINTKVGLDFSVVLRAFLRQDPDVIMVGEIRDHETAEIAMKAAQTGHLVLSTLHTNNAPETLSRLLNMGVEPYNIVSAIRLIIAQRLVRRLCEHCKEPYELDEPELLAQGFKRDDVGKFVLFKANGCSHCNQGYREREGIFQILSLTENMQKAIMDGCSATELASIAQQDGITDLRHAGLEKVKQGITSLEEVNRVTMEF